MIGHPVRAGATGPIALWFLVTAIAGPVGPADAAESGLRDPNSLKTEPYAYMAESKDQREQFRQRAVVAGFVNEIPVRIANPRDADFDGEFVIRIQEPDGTTNETHVPIGIAAQGEITLTVRATPSPQSPYYGFEALLQGTAGSWSGSTSSQFNFQVYPAVSVRLVSPAPRAGTATVQQLFRGGGGGNQGGAVAAASPDTELQFRVALHNYGTTVQAAKLRLISQGEHEGVGQDTNVTVAAHATKEAELGRLTPTSLEPRLSSGKDTAWFYFYVAQVRIQQNNQEQNEQAASFTITDGVVEDLEPAAINIDVRVGLNVDVEAAPTVGLGAALSAKVNVTNYGSETIRRNHVVVTFAPPYHANFVTQQSEASSYLLTVAPGRSHVQSLSFTPLISGRWTIEARWDDDRGPASVAKNVFSIDVPTDVDLEIPGAATTRVALGATAHTEARIKPLVPFSDATLRIATGLPDSGGGDGGSSLAVVGGLSAKVVRATPDATPLGRLEPGQDRTFSIAAKSRGAGTYYIVPYVVAGDFAYTGGILASGASSSATAVTNASAFEMTVLPGSAPAVLAFLPAVLVLAAGVAIHLGRRRWVR